jgi:hypothetical protein
MSVKGSWQRPEGDRKKFDEEYDRIFNKPKEGDYKPIRGLSFDYIIIDECDTIKDLGDVNDTDE